MIYMALNELSVGHSSCMSPTVSGMNDLCTILPWVWGPQFFNYDMSENVKKCEKNVGINDKKCQKYAQKCWKICQKYAKKCQLERLY